MPTEKYDHEIDTAELRPAAFYAAINHAINGQRVAVVEDGKIVAQIGPPDEDD
jgi:hypothetical protein